MHASSAWIALHGSNAAPFDADDDVLLFVLDVDGGAQLGFDDGVGGFENHGVATHAIPPSNTPTPRKASSVDAPRRGRDDFGTLGGACPSRIVPWGPTFATTSGAGCVAASASWTVRGSGGLGDGSVAGLGTVFATSVFGGAPGNVATGTSGDDSTACVSADQSSCTLG